MGGFQVCLGGASQTGGYLLLTSLLLLVLLMGLEQAEVQGEVQVQLVEVVVF